MSSRLIPAIVNGEVQEVRVVRRRITFFDLTERVIESDLPLPELYQKYEHAATIDEVDE